MGAEDNSNEATIQLARPHSSDGRALRRAEFTRGEAQLQRGAARREGDSNAQCSLARSLPEFRAQRRQHHRDNTAFSRRWLPRNNKLFFSFLFHLATWLMLHKRKRGAWTELLAGAEHSSRRLPRAAEFSSHACWAPAAHRRNGACAPGAIWRRAGLRAQLARGEGSGRERGGSERRRS